MSAQTAHNIEEKQRTEDIKISENVSFAAMLLSDDIFKGLQKCGFKKPSPIQLKAIPLGRCGFDLILKAKSGTGKTAVFGIIALEMVNLSKNNVQVLILAPTREIAVQIQQVITSIGCELKGLRVEYFIGGTPIKDDEGKLKNCHIAVGAPGRIKHLIEKKLLDVSETRLFVLDEADQLLQASYQANVNWVFNKFEGRKQVIAASATYPDELDKFLANYMKSPTHVSPNSNVTVLLGLKQFYTTVKSNFNVIQQMKYKTEELVRILSNLSFNQCLIFSNYQTRAESLSNNLVQLGWPSISISALQDQSARLKAVDDLKNFKCRILSSTDLTARGIDAANVDLVINYDVPYSTETYLHRMGRAGRYGSHGICITIASEGKDLEYLQKIIDELGPNMSIPKLPSDVKLLGDLAQSDVESFEKLYGLKNGNSEIKSSDLDASIELNCSEKDILQEKEMKIDQNLIDRDENIVSKDDSFLTKAISQLTEILSKPYINSINSNDLDNVRIVLEHIKEKNDTKRADLVDKLSNFDGANILNQIKAGTIKQDILDSSLNKDSFLSKPESVIVSENKKKKRDEQTEIIKHSTNSNFENEAKSFQQNMTLKKNVALYTISKFMVEQTQPVDEECVKNIDNLLEVIKIQDELEKEKYSPESIREFLGKNNIKKTQIDKFCDCKENLFSMVYDFAVAEDKANWINGVCEKHRIKESVDNLEEEVEDDEYMEEEFYEEEMENECEENLFSVAYDTAVQSNIPREPFGFAVEPNHEIYTQKTNENSNQFYETIDTQQSNCPSKKFVNFTPHVPVSKKLEPQKRKLAKDLPFVSPDVQNFVARRNAYSSYYQHYSDVLGQTAAKFEDVGDFQNWFRKWKLEVEAVRDFVQQDVYAKECRRDFYNL